MDETHPNLLESFPKDDLGRSGRIAPISADNTREWLIWPLRISRTVHQLGRLGVSRAYSKVLTPCS
jgi:hypothetical protein